MRALVIPVIATVLVVSVMAYQGIGDHTPTLAEFTPATFHELEGYASAPMEESEVERSLLPPDTLFRKREYVDGEGRSFQVVLVTNGRQRSSIHRPEVCLPAHGYALRDPRTVTVAGTDWRMITLARGEGPSSTMAYTAFNQAGRATSSHFERIFWDVWDRGILCRIDRWTQISVFSPGTDGDTLCRFLSRIGEIVR